MNFLALVNKILSMGQQTAVTALSTDVNEWAYKAQQCVNQAIKDLSLRLRIKTRIVEFQFNTVAGQQYYTIPKRLIYPFVTLQYGSEGGMIASAPIDFDTFSNVMIGIESHIYCLAGYSAVLGQPISAGETIYVKSSTSDTGTVVIQGYDAYDNYMSDTITLNGTTPVASAYQFKYIDAVSKNVTNGTITVYTTGATAYTLLQLAKKEKSIRYPVISILPIPSGVTTIYGRGYLNMPDLVSELDVPLGLDDTATSAIVSIAYARFLEYDPKVTPMARESYWQLADKEIGLLMKNDVQDGIQHRMKSPYEVQPKLTGYANPLDQ